MTASLTTDLGSLEAALTTYAAWEQRAAELVRLAQAHQDACWADQVPQDHGEAAVRATEAAQALLAAARGAADRFVERHGRIAEAIRAAGGSAAHNTWYGPARPPTPATPAGW